MKTERVNSTRVASSKTYVVENYGQAPAVVIHPDEFKPRKFDLQEHSAKVKASAPLKLSQVEIHRSTEV